MRPLGDKSHSNWPCRTRSGKHYGRTLRLSGDAKEMNGADLMPQDRTFTRDSVISVHEFQPQGETLEGGTQVLDDFTDGFCSELHDAISDTQVLEDSEDTCQAQRGSLVGEHYFSNECKDNNGTGLELEDMEGDTQILDDAEDMSHSQLANFGTDAEVNENRTCDENLCTQILDDHHEQLCTEGEVTPFDGRTTVAANGLCSSKEMDHCKSSSTYLTDGTLDSLEHTSGTFDTHAANNNDDASGYAPPRFSGIRTESMRASAAATQSRLEKKNSELNCSNSTSTNQSSQKEDEKDSNKSGYVPPRFTELRVEAWIAYGLEVKKRALSANTAVTFCSVGTSPAKQKHVDKENDNSVKGSPFNMEGTDDEDFTAFDEPGDGDFRDGRKVKCSAVRKLFAEELVSQTEACGSISIVDDESEPPAGEGDLDAVGLSYIDSQEPNDLAHTKALDFVEKFLTDNLVDIDTNDRGGSRVKNTNAVAHSKCKQSLVKKSILRSTVGFSKAFDWDDNNEDEGGGAFFCKLKEKTLKKESHFVKSATPKFNPANSEKLDNVSEHFKAKGMKRKLSYSDAGMVSQNMKKAAKNVEGHAIENVTNEWNREHCTGNNASHQNTPDMPIAGKDVSAGTSAVKESQADPDTYQLKTKAKGPSEGASMGWTRKGWYIKVCNLTKRARSSSDKVSDKCAQSMQIPTGWEGASQDAPTQNQDAKQPMEILACAGRSSRSGNGQIRTVLTSKGGPSGIDPGQMGQVEQIIPTQSKAKTCIRSNSDEAHLIPSKNAIPRRSCRLNKVTKLEDSHKQQISQGSNGCTLEHSGLTYDEEATHLPLQADASLEGLNSEYSLKRLTRRSTLSKEQQGKKRAFSSCELTSEESDQHIITNGTSEDLKINGRKSKREHDYKESHGNIRNQGKNSGIVTCTRQTRRASLQNSRNSAEIAHNDFVKPMEQPADRGHAKISITTSPIGHDPVEVNSKDTSIKVYNDQICQVQPVEHHMQFEPTSCDKIVCDPMNITSNQPRIPLRRSHRLNGSSAPEDLSVQNVHKKASAGATKEQLSHADFGTSVKDTAHKLETSPRGRTYIPCMECVTPTNSVKPSEEASPICMGNEYYISCNRNLLGSDLKKETNNLVSPPPKGTSGPRDSRKRRVITDVRVLLSRHLDENTLKHQKKILDRLGASLASSLSDATHFIADKFVRTKNMLEAIALGKPVVTPLWLVNCCKTRFHIDEKSYILRDVKKEKEFGFSMTVLLDLARQQPLLQKRRVFITPNTKPGKEVIACLVKAVGGQVIGRITASALRYSNIGDSLLILTCEEDFTICEPFMEKGAKVYSSELLLNGIVTQRLELERYLLFDNCRKRSTRRNGRIRMGK